MRTYCLAAAAVCLASSAFADPCASPANAIAAENCLPGNPSSQWGVIQAGDPTIQGFSTAISVNRGETLFLKIMTAATSYSVDLYRLGYYGGNGARKVASVTPSAALPQAQPACLTDPATGLMDCGNWAISASWVVPSTAVSGVYFARLTRADTGGASRVPFVVRDDAGRSALLFQTSDTTWQAYNNYGGNSLYVGSSTVNLNHAVKVSYNRPFNTASVASWVFTYEYPMIRWLERNGYDVSYLSGVDTDRSGALLLNHKVYLSVGHDEYWSGTQRANVEAARAAGVHLAFYSGNSIYWKTRWESSIDGSTTPYRTLVSYKETADNRTSDPLDPPTWTGLWRDPHFSPPADGGRPENALMGVLSWVPDYQQDAMNVDAAAGKLRYWRNTTAAALLPGQTTSYPSTLGYEWETDLDNGFRPPGLFHLSSSTFQKPKTLAGLNYAYVPGQAIHYLTLYRHASGALVFGAGTMDLIWSLDNQFENGPAVSSNTDIQQTAVNLLADMGVQPAALQSNLSPASASTDSTPPVSRVTAPFGGAIVAAGNTVVIAGTAADFGGGVLGGVEVSADGGSTWHPAVGRESWSYAWVPASSGTFTLKSRAVDDSGNLETPSAGTVVISTASSPLVLFSDSFAVPDGLITNEYAHWNPTDPSAVISPNWDMTSGSLFASGRQGWTGVPDDVSPNAASSNGNDSVVFSLTSKRTDFGNVSVSFSLFNVGLTTAPSSPAAPWDGVSAVLRLQSASTYYYLNVNRRDNTIAIKKRSSAGDATLLSAAYAVPYGSTQSVSAAAKNNPDGSVALTLSLNGSVLLSAADAAGLTAPGAVGIRGGNDNFKFGGFMVFSATASAPNPVPSLTALAPSSATAGGPGFTLNVFGANFVSGSMVQWNGSTRTTSFVSGSTLTAAISAGDIASSGTASVTVFSTGPGGGTSNTTAFNIAPPRPPPFISGLAPGFATAGGPGFALSVMGANFISSSAVQWNGSTRTTSFVSSSTLTAAILGADIASSGTAAVTVFSTGPGGVTSNALSFLIAAGSAPMNPLPSLRSLAPSSTTAGGPGFLLTVYGAYFIGGSTVQWNGSTRTTSFVSGSTLTAAILASDITSSGTATVTVFSTGPGGGASSAAAFLIVPAPNPVPFIGGLAPSSATAGGPAFLLTVYGANFIGSSAVQWNGSTRTTSFVSGSTLTATILAADISSSGTATVTVFSTGPGGGTSNAAAFAINAPAPPGAVLFSDLFGVPDGLVTNEYAHWNPSDPSSVLSSNWDMTSGSLFASGGQGWTGIPDDVSPNAASTNGTDSVVFNLTTKRTDFGDVSVSFSLVNLGLTTSHSTPAASWDGVSAVLRFQSASAYYYLNVNRRDNTIGIKKRSSSNDTTLASAAFTAPYGSTQSVQASAKNNPDGSVSLSLSINGAPLLSAADPAGLAAPGAVGFRGLNDNFKFGGFTVTSLSTAPAPALNPVPSLASLAPSSAPAGGSGFTLAAYGANFISGTVVQWNGSARATSFVGGSTLTAAILASDYASTGTAKVALFSPGPGGGTSNAISFLILNSTTPPNPVPSIASLAPSSAAAGGPGFALTVYGANFIAGSAVQWNGSTRTTSFVSGSTLTAAILAGDIASTGTATVTVFNPSPGGGTSNAAVFAINGSTSFGGALFADFFSVPDGLITNEYAYWNPADPNSVISPNWSMTSGSLFESGGQAWTGVPDNVSPNAASSNGTDSADFVLATKRTDFGNVVVSFSLTNQGLTTTSTTPAQPWDGVDVVLRYQSAKAYYYLEANRRDNTVAIKKKAGNNDVLLASGILYTVPFNAAQSLRASVFNNSNGSVSLALNINGLTLISATDSGQGGGPIKAAGAVGLRGGNDNFKFGGFTVSAIASLTTMNAPSAAEPAPSGVRVFPNPWRADKHAGVKITFDGLAPQGTVRIFTISGRLVRTLPVFAGAADWDATTDRGAAAASGYYVYALTGQDGRPIRGRLVIIR